MILSELKLEPKTISNDTSTMQTVVIYPGRFQPFHKGHKAVYEYLTKKYDNVYVATSDKVDPPRSPFSFVEKKSMMELTGMDTTNVVMTKNPYQAMEITQNFDTENTILMFAVSEKDMAEDPRFSFKPKKDGSPAYFQPAKDGNFKPMSQHGYILTVPTFKFNVLGEPMKSATEFRASFAKAKDQVKKQMIKDLFGGYNDRVFTMMSNKIFESANRHIKYPLIFETKDISRVELKEYYIRNNKQRCDRSFQTDVTDKERYFVRAILEETKEFQEIEPLLLSMKDTETVNKIKIGDYLSVLELDVSFGWGDIEASGFTEPKEVIDIETAGNQSIKRITFSDNTTYPKDSEIKPSYKNRPLYHAYFYKSKNDIKKALTFLSVKLPEGWKLFNKIDDNLEESRPFAQSGTDKNRIFAGIDRGIIDATTELEKLLNQIQELGPGTKVRQRFMIRFHNMINKVKQQMKMNIEIKEHFGLTESPNFPFVMTLLKQTDMTDRKIVNVIRNPESGDTEIKELESGKTLPLEYLSKLYKAGFRKIKDAGDVYAKTAMKQAGIDIPAGPTVENKINNTMEAQKLGTFIKNETRVSLWEHNGVIVMVDKKSQKLQETRSSVKEAVNELYKRGYIVEGIDIHTLTNAAGDMLRVFADTVKKTSTVRDAKGGSHTYQVPGEKLLHVLKQKGYDIAKDAELSLTPKDDRASNGSLALDGGGHEMNLMNGEEMDPEAGEDELMAGKRPPRYGFQKRKLKY